MFKDLFSKIVQLGKKYFFIFIGGEYPQQRRTKKKIDRYYSAPSRLSRIGIIGCKIRCSAHISSARRPHLFGQYLDIAAANLAGRRTAESGLSQRIFRFDTLCATASKDVLKNRE